MADTQQSLLLTITQKQRLVILGNNQIPFSFSFICFSNENSKQAIFMFA